MVDKRKRERNQAGEAEMGPAISEDRWELARFLTARIEELHITRKELAEESKISPATLREIEHPRKPRVFSRKILEPLAKVLELPPDYLFRGAYLTPSETPDPVIQGMMNALAPHLKKLDAIPDLQKDIAAIKAKLGMTVDIIYEDR